MRIKVLLFGLAATLSISVTAQAAGLNPQEARAKCAQELRGRGGGDLGGSRMAGVFESCMREKLGFVDCPPNTCGPIGAPRARSLNLCRAANCKRPPG